MKKSLLLLSAIISISSACSAQYGIPDLTFNGTGYVTINHPNGGSYGENILQTPDGGILISGGALNTDFDFAMAKFDLNGTPDAAFGINGISEVSFSAGYDYANGMALDAAGNIILSGSVESSDDDVALTRFFPDGRLDSSFALNGLYTRDFGDDDYFNCVAVQADGKIVAGGYISTSPQEMILARFNSNGTPDSTFGVNGLVRSFTMDAIKDLKILNDGTILVSGYYSSGQLVYMAIAEFTSTGNVKSGFGLGGRQVFALPSSTYNVGWKLGFQNDGKIILAGESFVAYSKMTVARFDTAGGLDGTFGISGYSAQDFGIGASAYAMLVQPDNKIVLGGYSSNKFALLRYDENGMTDTTFGTAGLVNNDFGTGNFASISCLILETDNKILAGGTIADPIRSMGIGRYTSGLAVGINDFQKPVISANVFPNPVNDRCNLNFSLNKNEKLSIGIFDLQGRMIKQITEDNYFSAGENNLTFDMSSLSPGFYQLLLISNNSKTVLPLVKQ